MSETKQGHPIEPLVAVVVPVYNGGEFIHEALNSVQGQTYSNWECTVLDNVSTDGTADVVASFTTRDPRFRLVRASTHVGIYANHNRALDAAAREAAYVKVLHADDWMAPDCLERMVTVAERNPTVGVVGGWRLYGETRDLDSLPSDQDVFDGREIVRMSLTGGPYVTGSPSSSLLRPSIFDGRRAFYDESIWHSDTEAIYNALLRSDLGYVHDVVTFTRLHPAANTPYSNEVLTFAPENILMLCRHGKAVLTKRENRRRLTVELAGYGWFLAKQLLKPSRHRDPRFRAFHLDAIRRARQEAPRGSLTAATLHLFSWGVRLQGVGRRNTPRVAPPR